jgi:hypothetical protein
VLAPSTGAYRRGTKDSNLWEVGLLNSIEDGYIALSLHFRP